MSYDSAGSSSACFVIGFFFAKFDFFIFTFYFILFMYIPFVCHPIADFLFSAGMLNIRSFMGGFAHDAMGRRIYLSWWNH